MVIVRLVLLLGRNPDRPPQRRLGEDILVGNQIDNSGSVRRRMRAWIGLDVDRLDWVIEVDALERNVANTVHRSVWRNGAYRSSNAVGDVDVMKMQLL